MANGGMAFFVSESNRMAQQFSVAANAIGPLTAEVVEAALDKGVSRMKQIIMAGGMNQTKKGGPRVKSGAMLASVEGVVTGNNRGRVQGKFGFSDSTPHYTKYQEKGTRRISQMLAFATANKEMVDELVSTFGKGNWFNINL